MATDTAKVLDTLGKMTVLELVGGAYLERATVLDEEPYDAVLPFPVRVVPSALLV